MAKWTPIRRNTKEFHIYSLACDGKTALEIYYALVEKVRAQEHPMVFSSNVGGRRVPKEITEQVLQLRYAINRVLKKMEIEDELPEQGDIPEEEFEPSGFSPIPEAVELPEDIEQALEAEESAPEVESPDSDERKFFLSEVRRIRRWCETRESNGDYVDSISMRPVIAAKTGFPEGISAKALLYAMTIHWTQEDRAMAEVADYDFQRDSTPAQNRKHKLLGYCLKLAKARIPIYLQGPKGTGKSYLAKQIANELFPESYDAEQDTNSMYGEIPMTMGATPAWLTGAYNLKGWTSRPFVDIYENGGVFCFEEIDSADPNMLLVVNNALSANEFFNPANGKRYRKSANFVAAATANTFGLGANMAYTGRERLDEATIDRWRMGRVTIGIDESLEHSLLFDN